MKNLTKTILFIIGCVCIAGCSVQEAPAKPSTIIEETPTILSETEKAEDMSATDKIGTEENDMPKSHFSNAGIEFDYPSDLNAEEKHGEDGIKQEFTKDGTPVFWYEQGENWRIDMGWDKDAYQKVLENRYPNAIIDTYAKTTINNLEMIKVVFSPSGQDTGETYEEYIFVSQYAFYDFYFINAKDSFAEEVIASVNLTANVS